MPLVRCSLALVVAIGCAGPFRGFKRSPTATPAAASEGVTAGAAANDMAETNHGNVTAEHVASAQSANGGNVQAAASMPATANGATPDELAQIVAQVDELGELPEGTRARMIEDLRATPAHLRPHLIHSFRASLAYQRRAQERQTTHGEAAIADQTPPPMPSPRADNVARHTSEPQGAAVSYAGDVPPVGMPRAADQTAPASSGQLPPAMPQEMSIPSGGVGARIDPAAVLPHSATPRPQGLVPQDHTLPPARALNQPSASAPVEQVISLALAEDSPGMANGAEHADPYMPPAVAAVALATVATTPPAASQIVNVAHVAPNVEAPIESALLKPIVTDGDWRTELAAAIHDLEGQTGQEPRDAAEVARHAQLRLLYLAAGRKEDALVSIPGVPAAQQDYWSHQLFAISWLLDTERERDASRRAALAAGEMDEAAAHLAEIAPLRVTGLAFCTEVKSYGVHTPFDDETFTPGQQVLVYAEVENQKSEPTERGYHTSLQGSYQILDAQGRRVEAHDLALMEEHCRNRRRDYFLSYALELPARLYDGKYTLQLLIEDRLSQKLGQSSIEFTIAHDGA